jgi:hypothetical protein
MPAISADATSCYAQICVAGLATSAKCNATAGDLIYLPKENALCLNADIDEEGKLLNRLESYRIRRGVRLFIKKSNGGDVARAISMARHLRAFKYDAYVLGSCFSACAQFLFLGARRKIISGHGIIAMHGGPLTDNEVDNLSLSEDAKSVAKSVFHDWVKFYRTARIPMEIVTSFPDSLKAEMSRDNRVEFWVPTKSDFLKYNIHVRFCSADEYR